MKATVRLQAFGRGNGVMKHHLIGLSRREESKESLGGADTRMTLPGDQEQD